MESRYGLLTTATEPIPLKGVRVEGDILGRGARVRVLQRFKNEESKAVEAVYRFPLPEGAAICGFKACIGKRIIEGKVEERFKAFDIYDEAVSKGHGAYLLDQERPNIFTLSVGNLKPEQEATVAIEYVTQLDTDGPSVRFFLPTTISPRYVPADMPEDDGIPEEERIHPAYAFDVPYGLSMALNVHGSEQIKSVESPSHAIKVDMAGPSIGISLGTDSVRMDRDFILYVNYKESSVSRAYRCRRGKDTFLQADFVLDDAEADISKHRDARASDRRKHASGKRKKEPERKREIIFVLDCSGSMMGDSIAEAKKALEICLRALHPGTFFNIYRFGFAFESLFEAPVKYDRKSVATALEYLQEVEADLGGTEILGPLRHIYDHKIHKGCRSREIILITDGQVANEREVFWLAKAGRRKTRVFTIGIGAGVNEHLIKELARSGGGASEFIYPGERIEPKVMAIFGKAGEVLLGEPRVLWGVRDAEQAPASIAFFGGMPATLIARCRGASKGKDKLVVKGKIEGQARRWEIPIADVAQNGLPTPALWAKERIQDLEESDPGQGDRGSRQAGRKTDRIRRQIIELAKAYGLMSRLTSYIAVEKRKARDKAKGEIVLRKVPALVTTGWHGIGSIVVRHPPMRRSAPAGRRMMFCLPSIEDAAAGPDASRASDDLIRPKTPPGPVFQALRMSSKLPPKSVRDRIKAHKRQMERAGEQRGATVTDALTEILSVQDVDGSFELNKEVAKRLGLKIGDVKRVAREVTVGTKVDRLRLLSTAIVLKTLTTYFPGYLETYRGVIKKSASWLRRIVEEGKPRIGKQNLMAWVADYVKNKVRIEFS